MDFEENVNLKDNDEEFMAGLGERNIMNNDNLNENPQISIILHNFNQNC